MGKVLDGFGFYGAALEQETAVIRQDPKDIEAYIFRGQIAIKHRAVNAADGQQGLTDLSIALALDAARSPSVVEAYLAGLVQTGQAAAAVALYERWANEGLVPLPIAAAPNEILHLPPNQRLRVTYAQALAQSHQDGTREQQALALIHMRSDVEIPDILAQGRGIVADEEIMEGIPGPNIACRTPLVSYAPHLQDVAITAK